MKELQKKTKGDRRERGEDIKEFEENQRFGDLLIRKEGKEKTKGIELKKSSGENIVWNC